MEIGNRKELALPCGEPSLPRLPLALRTMAVAAGVIGDAGRAAGMDGHEFTMSFLPAHNNQFAQLAFAGSKRAIKMKNQGMASGIAYAGRGWEYHEWQGKSTLIDVRSATPEEIACSRN